jgi:acetoin utilization deacetylase AcuC-like enzyme
VCTIFSDDANSGLAYDSAMSKHQCVCGNNKNHVEHGGRVHSIWARLQERGLVDMCERVNARKAALDLLRIVHSDTYVTFFAVSPTACLKIDPAQLPVRSFVQLPCGGIGVDSDTYFNDANTQLATRISVGSLVELCSQVRQHKFHKRSIAWRVSIHAIIDCFLRFARAETRARVSATLLTMSAQSRKLCADACIIDDTLAIYSMKY